MPLEVDGPAPDNPLTSLLPRPPSQEVRLMPPGVWICQNLLSLKVLMSIHSTILHYLSGACTDAQTSLWTEISYSSAGGGLKGLSDQLRDTRHSPSNASWVFLCVSSLWEMHKMADTPDKPDCWSGSRDPTALRRGPGPCRMTVETPALNHVTALPVVLPAVGGPTLKWSLVVSLGWTSQNSKYWAVFFLALSFSS